MTRLSDSSRAARTARPRPLQPSSRRASGRPRQARAEVEQPDAGADDGLSINDRVYAALKELITSNQLRPGVKLTHEGLAERLRVSRTPVRECLERLYQEGLVTRLPRRGFFVAEIDEVEARELYELREALEIYALRRSMARGLKRAQIQQLDAFNQRYRQLLRDESTRERMVVDRDFHLTLASFADNRALLRSLEAAFERLVMKIRVEGYRTVRGAEALEEHLALMKAIRAKDLPLAERLLAEHIQGARRRLANHLASLAA